VRPFNRAGVHISWWNNDRRLQGSIASPRMVDKKFASSDFVWKMEDKKLLS
jgi:hypothetical protein